MSTARIAPPPIPREKMPLGPNGRRLCRWCSTEVPKGRITFCSEQCVEEFNIRRSPSHARYLVKQRDKGVCAKCGCDTALLKRILRLAARSRHTSEGRTCCKYLYCRINAWDAAESAILRRLGFESKISLWAADHIIEVADGDGESGLENYQTLCVPCHQEKTAESRRARIKQKQLAAAREGFINETAARIQNGAET